MANFTSKRTNETDFYTAEWDILDKDAGRKITFKYEPYEYVAPDYDWYMLVALEKAEKVTINRHLLTSSLLLKYRNAIREGYNHQLDKSLRNRWDYPTNRNTIDGIEGYIKRIEKASNEEMKQWENLSAGE